MSACVRWQPRKRGLLAGRAEDMDQGYGGWSRRPSVGWGEQGLPRVRHTQGAGGAYSRVRLPQFGRPERWPEHARAAHWTAAPSLPQCCVPIGRRLLGRWAEPCEPTLRLALGGALGRPVCFCPSVPVGPPALPNALLPDPSFSSEDATKWRRWGRSQGRSSWETRPFSPAEGLSQDLAGLGAASARRSLSGTLILGRPRGSAGSDPLLPAPRYRVAGPRAASAGLILAET